MNLLYLWIEPSEGQRLHSNVEKGLNFSSKYDISYDENVKKVRISCNDSYVEGLFDTKLPEDDKDLAFIEDIKAVIGQNGSGKTSLIRRVLSVFSYNAQENGFVIYEYNKKIHTLAFSSYTEPDDRQIFNEKFFNIKFLDEHVFSEIKSFFKKEGKDFSTPRFAVMNGNYDRADSDDLSIIYLSSVFEIFKSDEKNGRIIWQNSNQLYYDYVKKHDDIKSALYSRVPDKYDVYSYEEFRIQLEFVNLIRKNKEHFANLLDFVLPNVVFVGIADIEAMIEKYNNNVKHHGSRSYFYTDSNVIRFIQNLKKPSERVNVHNGKFIESCVTNEYLYIAIFLSFVLEDYLHDNQSDVSRYLIGHESNFQNAFDVENASLSIYSFFEKLNALVEVELYETFVDAEKFNIISIWKLLEYVNSSELNQIRRIYNDMDYFYEVFEMYKDTFDSFPYLTFSWQGVSSGENAWLTLFSRLYSISDFAEKEDYIRRDRKLSHNVLLFIDEGELYMHPEWQRGFIYSLLPFIRRVFAYKDDSYLIHKNKAHYKGQRHVHIVLTSNSPFVASDLPKNHCLFLKNKYGAINEVPHDEVFKKNENSFGGNIHELLMKPFFMKASIGEFSQDVIKEIAAFLSDTSTKCSHDQQLVCWKKIELIGEPLVRGKLREMFRERFPEIESSEQND